MIDVSSRFVHLRALPDKRSDHVAEALLSCILEAGTFPSLIQSDRGSEFLNKLLEELLVALNVKQKFSPAYAPWVNGIVERSHQTVATVLRSLVTALCAEQPAQ
jgi:transposase InsO family protein